MKYLLSILLAFMLIACDSNIPALNSSTPTGTYVSADGKDSLTFTSGHVKYSSNVKSDVGTTVFVMEDGIAKWQFDGGMPMTFKKNMLPIRKYSCLARILGG